MILRSYKIEHSDSFSIGILVFFVFIWILILPSCHNGTDSIKGNKIPLNNNQSATYIGPIIQFDTTIYDFGRVYEGESVGWYFKFKNSGDKSLVLTNVSASCGCTTPEYSKEPILPGEEGQIKVVFDSNGRSGNQFKTIHVESNSIEGSVELTITANIIKK